MIRERRPWRFARWPGLALVRARDGCPARACGEPCGAADCTCVPCACARCVYRRERARLGRSAGLDDDPLAAAARLLEDVPAAPAPALAVETVQMGLFRC